MAEPAPETIHQPYIPPEQAPHEFTLPAVLVGAVLGIVFGASSLYLLLKVGMTVSASVPIAVLSITLFRAFSKGFGFRRATILENNIVQTAGSAGESIAFGVGVTMPALLLLGFEMEVTRVMVVAVLGGVLGILMMIPLRKAFIVKQHGKLTYPEGTACAEVLIAGEKGGSSARMVFLGFGIAALYKLLSQACNLWPDTPSALLHGKDGQGNVQGLKGADISGELTPELLGVGYLIGPRIASLMIGGALLSYFVLGPMIATFGDKLEVPLSPAVSDIDAKTQKDVGLIRNMSPNQIKNNYLRYIGAGAVAAGGIISMLRALPLIIASVISGLRDLRATRSGQQEHVPRTDHDMPMNVVLFGSLGLAAVLMFVPSLGLGVSLWGLLGAFMVLLFGFLFVTVSSRLTGEVGSSSNPISGMTIATLLMTCLVFLFLGRTVQNDPSVLLTALMVSAVVCIASSNGGTTSQDLKTGFLVGATPYKQQWAILVGAITSALVIGVTMLLLNDIGTHYTNKGLPEAKLPIADDDPREKVGRPHSSDSNLYHVVHVRKGKDIKPGRYLVDEAGRAKYRTDMPVARVSTTDDNGKEVPPGFAAPQPQLFALITEGILGGELEWGLVVLGVLIAFAVELAGVSALPFAVGMYLPLSASTPIFAGGLVRWLTDKLRGKPVSEAESETSPGVLLSSGYIAGGTLTGLVLAFVLLPESVRKTLDLKKYLPSDYVVADAPGPKLVALAVFAVLAAILAWIGLRKAPEEKLTP